MLIPYQLLAKETLQTLIEEFVTRDGTDNGDETSLEVKVQHVINALEHKEAVIAFDEETESCQLMLKQDVPQHWLAELTE